MKNLYNLKNTFLLVFVLVFGMSYAQVGIGTTSPADGALLDLTSANKGLLVPRVNITDLTTILPVTPGTASGTDGLLVWNTNGTTGVGFHYWDGNDWIPLSAAASIDWTLIGNNLTIPEAGTPTTNGTRFIGTTNSRNINFRTNNTYRGRFSNLGEFFVGTLSTVITGDLMNAVGNTTFPWAVNGYTDFNGGGVYGSVQSGTTLFGGVQGEYVGSNNTGTGVRGIYLGSGLGSGVNGQNSGATAGIRPGVLGESISGFGTAQIGVQGQYNGGAWGIGLMGVGFGGAVPTGFLDFAVVGWSANNSNFSGYFNGNHVIANGTKSASVGTSKGNQLLYVTESPEVWFEDMGRGRLVNGQVTIELDKLFLETVFVDDEHPMIVFLQEEGDSNGLFVETGTSSFTVKEKGNGTSNISFSYKISAKRKHFQDHRFGNDPVWGSGDTRRYNQYATPPPVDYHENVRFQEEQKKNYKPTPLPEGFTNFVELQKKMKTKTTRPTEDNGARKALSDKQEAENNKKTEKTKKIEESTETITNKKKS